MPIGLKPRKSFVHHPLWASSKGFKSISPNLLHRTDSYNSNCIPQPFPPQEQTASSMPHLRFFFPHMWKKNITRNSEWETEGLLSRALVSNECPSGPTYWHLVWSTAEAYGGPSSVLPSLPTSSCTLTVTRTHGHQPLFWFLPPARRLLEATIGGGTVTISPFLLTWM